MVAETVHPLPTAQERHLRRHGLGCVLADNAKGCRDSTQPRMRAPMPGSAAVPSVFPPHSGASICSTAAAFFGHSWCCGNGGRPQPPARLVTKQPRRPAPHCAAAMIAAPDWRAPHAARVSRRLRRRAGSRRSRHLRRSRACRRGSCSRDPCRRMSSCHGKRGPEERAEQRRPDCNIPRAGTGLCSIPGERCAGQPISRSARRPARPSVPAIAAMPSATGLGTGSPLARRRARRSRSGSPGMRTRSTPASGGRSRT